MWEDNMLYNACTRQTHRITRTGILINPHFIDVKTEVQSGQVTHSDIYPPCNWQNSDF